MELRLNLNEYDTYLSDMTLKRLSLSYDAYQNKDYFSASVLGAVFLETFLGEWIERKNHSLTKKDDLNSRISFIRGIDLAPRDIISRCDSIRNIRNRLVHDSGATIITYEQDAKQIFNDLSEILNWYVSVNEPLFKQQPTIEESVDRVPIFLSTLNPDNESQRFFIEKFKKRLREIGIEPVQCVFEFYDSKDPLRRVRETINSCEAVIALGLERSNAYYIKDKEGTSKEQVATHRKYTSGWLHLESGMANALNKEVFVLCQHDIYSDGVFDRNWNTYPVLEFRILDPDSRDFTIFFDYLKKWAESYLLKEQEEIYTAAEEIE